jgi:DNA-binding LacI/PurR family transcriptional regulator
MSRKLPPRSIDVARLAGVSRSAVSRTFTEGAYVSPETRERVLNAARLLNYSPNVIARSLTKQRTRIVGVAITDLRNRFYAELLEELSRQLQSNGLATLLVVTDREEVDAGISRLLDYQVDAVILAAVMLSSGLAARCREWGKPVVLVDRYIDNDGITSITGDNVAGAALVADAFLQAGYERIAFMSGHKDTSSSRDRERGFKDRLAEHGTLVYASECGDYTHAEAAEAMRRLLSRSPPPDAVFCANDLMAVSAMRVARSEFGLRVPEDVAIAGYDNALADSHDGGDLTTVDQNVEGMAKMAVEAVVERIADPGLPAEHLSVESRLIERRTTRAAVFGR